MIKVIKSKNTIEILGHALYDDYGKDIVCASTSCIFITSINACIRIDKDFLTYEENKDGMKITIKGHNKDCLIIIDNMLDLLEELANEYKDYIKVRRN